jgi:hypothetical protein
MFKLIYYRLQALHASRGKPITPLSRFRFLDYYDFLNNNGMLVAQKLALREQVGKVIAPFRLTDQNTPQWWQAYNDTKHDLPEGETFGKLGHVLYALAAVASLHDIAQMLKSANALPTKVLDGTRWYDKEEKFMIEYERTKHKSYHDAVVDHVGERKNVSHKSSIFYYLTEFMQANDVKQLLYDNSKGE